MKKRTMKLMALLTASALVCTCVPFVAYAEEATESDAGEATDADASASDAAEAAYETTETDGGVITIMQAGANEVLVYYPNDNISETSAVKTTCTAPVFMVFGSGKYDTDTASAYAVESGLAALAAENGSSVVFVNPVGDTWSEEDAEAYGTIAQLINDSSTDSSENGITVSANYLTGETEVKVVGTQSRIYIYAENGGADYVADVALKTVEAATFWGGTVNVTPAGVTLSGLSDTEGVEANDIPVVSIGNSEEANAILEENCGSVLTVDAADYTAEYEEVIGNNRRQAGVLLPIYDYAAEGIVETVETYTVETTEDNASDAYAGTEEHPISVVTYYAEDLDVENGNVPLVLCFHGGGNTALFEAQATEWPLIGKENGFITVSVDQHYPNCTAGEIVELIEQLEEKYSIDSTRIYASGFSMGGCKSWDLYEQYPEIFAGLAPMDASNEPAVDSYGNAVENTNSDVIVPVFYVGGETSPLEEMPFQAEKLVDRLSSLFEVNQITKEYNCSFDAQDEWENSIWGVNGDITYQVTDQKAFLDSTLTVELFQSEDGNYYTAVANASNQSHEVYARNSWAAWDFLSQFSRQEDGSIAISEVTYSLSADDGSVVDNSYNMEAAE
ncbi:MAG: hypothetical protein LUG62_09820 [Clostridiales bacterium]|nr:hypothetical protein [Clostridiales bacterium]